MEESQVKHDIRNLDSNNFDSNTNYELNIKGKGILSLLDVK